MELGDRRTYLGASDAAQALGLLPPGWGTRHELWAYMTGRMPKKKHKPVFDRGHALEDDILDIMRQRHGLEVHSEQMEFHDPERPWLRCHVDAVAERHVPKTYPDGQVDPTLPGRGVIEVKAPASRTVESWRELGMPDNYVIQTQLQIYMATKCSPYNLPDYGWSRFAFLDYDQWDLPFFDQRYDEAFVQSLLPGLEEFWRCVETDTPPPDVPAKAIEIPQVDGTLHVAEEGTELHEALSMATEHYLMRKNAEALYEKATEEAKRLLGDMSKVKVPDFATVSYYWNKGRSSVKGGDLLRWTEELCEALSGKQYDTAARMAEAFRPDMFQTPGAPYRVLRITPAGAAKDLMDKAKDGEL